MLQEVVQFHKYPPNNKCSIPLKPAKLQATAINKISTLPD